MNLRWSRWLLILLLPAAATLMWLSVRKPAAPPHLAVPVKRGKFTVVVTAPGELRARRSVQIKAPAGAVEAGAFQMKIAAMVPEGTIVKQGDFVAELDRAGMATRLQEVTVALQKAEAQLTQVELDTALTLSEAREDIRNLELALQEKSLAKEQSAFEAPSVQRQADLDRERTERELEQAKANYRTKANQAVAKTSEVAAEVGRQRGLLASTREMLAGFTIRAPSAGMVIYVREWNGRKRGVGAQLNPWEPSVATLPDLSELESVAYVNEIDVGRVAVGQGVQIAIDAVPDGRLRGKVTAVANVGDQRANSDAKVFEVTIAVDSTRPSLRPGMTTANAIETASIPDALTVPLEAVHAAGDTAFVYRVDGIATLRQTIETGLVGENEIVVLRGLAAGDRVLLADP